MMRKRPFSYMLAAFLALFVSVGASLAAPPETQAILDSYLSEAKKAESGIKSFSADEGKKFFLSKRTHTVKKEERSCTTCHTENPAVQGKTPVGKAIEPMAPSANKERFSDAKKLEKWFKRNCEWVLERECTPKEKGDFITFMLTR